MISINDIVRLKSSFLNEEMGTLAFVYELDDDDTRFAGVSLITENGTYIDMNPKEKIEYLEFVRESNIDYRFTNVLRLNYDFNRGIFKDAFEAAK